MAIQVRWLDDRKKIILAEYIGPFTRQDNQKSVEQRKQLSSEITYPVGAIEDESQGYLVDRTDISTPNRLRVGHSYLSSTGFSGDSNLRPNRIAVTIKIPYVLDTWETEETGEQWNAHSRDKLQTVLQYPTLESVMVTMTIGIEEAKEIILDYLTRLDSARS